MKKIIKNKTNNIVTLAMITINAPPKSGCKKIIYAGILIRNIEYIKLLQLFQKLKGFSG
jgi:hypothetical protein